MAKKKAKKKTTKQERADAADTEGVQDELEREAEAEAEAVNADEVGVVGDEPTEKLKQTSCPNCKAQKVIAAKDQTGRTKCARCGKVYSY